MEGDFTLQNVIQIYGVKRSIENPLKHLSASVSKLYDNIESNNPFYCFTLPGLFSVIWGVYIALNYMQIFHSGGSFDFKYTALVILLILLGALMTFMGILLHSIAGLIRYKANKL